MPTLLRRNRFLKLFSEDTENRAAFIQQGNLHKDLLSNSKIVYAIGKKGAIFNKFELALPKEVKIKKKGFNELEFEMKYFNLKIKYIFDGCSTFVDPEFYKYYLNLIYSPIKYNDLQFTIKISVKFKKRILFTKQKTENYMWIDELLNSLMEYANVESFYNRIHWQSNKCFIRCLRNSRQKDK